MRFLLALVILALVGASPLTAAQEEEAPAEERVEEILEDASEDEEAPPFEGVEEIEEPPDQEGSENDSDDRFIPTEQLRYDQEVDYPTDI